MQKTSIGLDENVACFLSYLFGWVSGLVIFLIEKDNQTVRFHAAQSIILFGAISIIQTVFGYGAMFVTGLFGLLSLATLVIWIFLLVKSWTKDYFKIPVISDIADNFVKNVKV